MSLYRFKISFNSEGYIIEDILASDPEEAYAYMYEEYPDAQIECTDLIEK